MKYNVLDHGDILEHEAAEFIRQYIPGYELLWQTYIGHKGNGQRADLPNYPDEKKREKFAEHSYTVLEGLYLAHNILESGSLEKKITSFKDYIDFNFSFNSFMAQVGRVKDNLYRGCVQMYKEEDCGQLFEDLKSIFEARNIVLHGRKLPYTIDDLGLIKLPSIYSKSVQDVVWDDKNDLWKDAANHLQEYPSDTCRNIFNDLVRLVNGAYMKWFQSITEELKDLGTSLVFYYPGKSGVTGVGPIIGTTGTSSSDGRHGSSGGWYNK